MRFKSVLNPGKYGYEWTNDSMTFWDQIYRSGLNYLHGAAAYYETFGDGDCQHTPLMPAPLSLMSDFCISMTAHLLSAAGSDSLDRFSCYLLDPEISADVPPFLASIRYKDDKPQWYNLQDRKVSAADSKRHDKRWHEVPRWADGSIASAVQLYWICAREAGMPNEAFKRYMVESLFWDSLYNKAAQGDDWEKLTEYRSRLGGSHCDSWRALNEAVQAIKRLQYARRCMDCAIHNSTPREQVAA